MGVRGLTGYIARNAEIYLRPYELHDCNLVIDGDNLACNLYKDVTGTYSAFGGDYDDFFRAVVEFFHVLAECNVHAYVLMDGGYEKRKLRTVAQRLRGKIAIIKRINPCGSVTIFPLLLKEVFVDAVRSCGVPVMRCPFEADDELAALSRKLNCPVLSYDSDFYIFNVQYIPLITLTVKAHTKRLKEDKTSSADDTATASPRKLAKNEARRMEKRTKAHHIMGDIQVDNVERRAPKGGKTYKYMDCCLYRVEHLIARGTSLSKEKMPLFAALLGNDYISRSAFTKFFNVGMGKIGRSKKCKQQQRRILVIMDWLKHETAESALQKILSRLTKAQKESIIEQVAAATEGYSNERCRSYDYFIANYSTAFRRFDQPQLEEWHAVEGEEEDEDGDWEVEEDEVEQTNEGRSTKGNDCVQEEEQVNDSDDEEEDEDDDDDVEDEGLGADDSSDGDATDDKINRLPAWFLEKLFPAHLGRFFVDLMHLHKYINSPQIEHYPYSDCNEIAVPILVYIFTLLNSVQGVPVRKLVAEDGTETLPYFTYMTRCMRVTNIHYVRYEMEEPPQIAFNPRAPNPLLLRRIFTGTMHQFNPDALFVSVAELPADLQLYMLAVVFWLQKSQHCDLTHLHALLVCLVTLRTIDTKITAERDQKAFQKRYGKVVKKERLVRVTEAQQGVKRGVREDLLGLPAADRMEYVPKSDCLLVMSELLKHFHMQEIFKKKYDTYSTTVLHALAEFQCVVYQLHSLNALLDFPHKRPQLGGLFSGVFLYNLYDLLHTRADMRYYVQNYIFADSNMMYDFYAYLLDWCEPFIPSWKREKLQVVTQTLSKKLAKKQRQTARKKAATEQKVVDPCADMLEHESDKDHNEQEDDFYDLNNKFCAFLKINK